MRWDITTKTWDYITEMNHSIEHFEKQLKYFDNIILLKQYACMVILPLNGIAKIYGKPIDTKILVLLKPYFDIDFSSFLFDRYRVVVGMVII